MLTPAGSSAEFGAIPVTSAALLSRIGWATTVQVLSSVTNVSIAFVAARSLTPSGFGAFNVAFAVFVFVAGTSRAVVIEPLLSRPWLAAGSHRHSTRAATSGAAVGLSVLASTLVGLLGLALGGQIGGPLLAIAVTLPGLVLQDTWRYCFIAEGKFRAAALNELVWVAGQVLFVWGMTHMERTSAMVIVLGWGGAGTVASLVGTAQARTFPHVRAGRGWVLEQRGLGARYCTEFIAATGAAQGTLIAMGATVGLASLGAVRAAQTFFGPLNVLFSAINLAVVPEAARLRAEPRRMLKLTLVVAFSLAVVTVTWLCLGLAVPHRIGRQLLGDSWPGARHLFPLVGSAVAAGGLAGGAIIGMRALAAAKESLRARLLALPAVVTLPLLGAHLREATGFAVGLLIATLVGVAISWWHFISVNIPSSESES